MSDKSGGREEVCRTENIVAREHALQRCCEYRVSEKLVGHTPVTRPELKVNWIIVDIREFNLQRDNVI